MKKFLLLAACASVAAAASAQTYITAAPAGGFDVNSGKDYIVLYAPDDVIAAMGSKVIANENLDQNQVDNYLEYWVTDWDKKDLTLYNVPAAEGETNSFGGTDFINATPLYAWGTGVFMPKAKAYDLSKVTNNHRVHIGLRDFGSSPSKYQFSIGSQKTIASNGFQIMVGKPLGDAVGNFVSLGSLPSGNDGKWYYIDVPVADLIDPNGNFGFEYNFSAPISDGVFTFTFNDPVCSTATKSGPAPGESVYSYTVTKLGSALSLDHVFFYIPDASGVEGITVAPEEVVEGIYNITGRRVENPGTGLYIIKSNLGTRKVYLR